MKRKKESLVLGKILQRLAAGIGASVVLEPEWGIVGQITFRNGRRSYFRYNTLDLNPVGSADVAKDKDYTNFFMQRMGYPIVPGSRTFFRTEWAKAIGMLNRNIDAAYRHARRLGFPVVVKPNSGSQGIDVTRVSTRREFYRAMRAVFKHDRVALVQRPVPGQDYRLVVLDQGLISAYEQIPLNVVGDGRRTIRQLLDRKQRQFIAAGRDTRIRPNDPRIAEKLKRGGFSLRHVPTKGKRIFLLDNANLSSGGDAVDVSDQVHPSFRQLAIKLTRDMGLRLCGVDLIVDGRIDQPAKDFWVLEVNAAPGLDHYARTGKAQERIVEKLYFQVLKSLER